MQSPAETLRRAAAHIEAEGKATRAFFEKPHMNADIRACPACTVGAIIIGAGMVDQYKQDMGSLTLAEFLDQPEIDEPVKLLDSHLQRIYSGDRRVAGQYPYETSTVPRARIFDWSDRSSQTEVIASLRAAAAVAIEEEK